MNKALLTVILSAFAAASAFGFESVMDIPVPDGYARHQFAPDSFSHYLQRLPLKADKTIYTWDGQRVQGKLYNVFAVVDQPLLFKADLEHCADFCMRFWADYHKRHDQLHNLFLYDYSGRKHYFASGNRSFRNFLKWHMAFANSYSIKKGANPINGDALRPGDMFVQNTNGGIGHVSMIVDAAQDARGETVFLIGYGLIPAQEFHIEQAYARHGTHGWFTRKGFEQYLSRFQFKQYGKPVLRRFD
jgi:hypothetical protein